MSTILTDSQHYKDIANAIRSKAGTTDTYKPADMAEAIANISGGIPTYDFAEMYKSGSWPEEAATIFYLKTSINFTFMYGSEGVGVGYSKGATACISRADDCTALYVGGTAIYVEDGAWTVTYESNNNLYRFSLTVDSYNDITYYTNFFYTSDTSRDTVTADTLLEGYTAHDSEGNAITGTYSGGGTEPYPAGSKVLYSCIITPYVISGTSLNKFETYAEGGE